MKLVTPKMYQKSIYTVNYQKLKKDNIKCLLFDLDNTCVSYHEKEPNQKLEKLFKKLKKDGFKVIIFSNAPKKRLKPFKKLDVICHHSSKKPLKHSFKNIFKDYDFKPEEVCIIGDQLFTDILGGNRVGIATCLVDPISNADFVLTKIFRWMEGLVFRKLKQNNILKKGDYYD